MTNLVSKIIDWQGHKVKFTWIPDVDPAKYTPFFQVYGIVFNDDGQVLIINENDRWGIPGGTPENNETAQETLEREMMEEADVTLKNIQFIGAQLTEFLDGDNPNKKQGNSFYQMRFIADIDRLQIQTPDPDGGETHPRKFVPLEELNGIVKWGETGDAIFRSAFETHKKD